MGFCDNFVFPRKELALGDKLRCAGRFFCFHFFSKEATQNQQKLETNLSALQVLI